MEQENRRSVLEIFAQSQETFDEAKKKASDESGKRIEHFRMNQDGVFPLRILPLAPIIDADGKVLPMDRKGYEYPIKSQILKINAGVDKNGKEKTVYVNVCNAKYAFPKLECDLIDKYVQIVNSQYADDKELCDKVKETGFSGGLKWNAKRCMYVLNMEKRGDGIQILELSYSQYKDLEDRKMALWTKLNKNGNVPCPISSIANAYPLEITRKTENKKTSYSFGIDTISGVDQLSEAELTTLLDSPRLPEVLYRYTRYHLEATIEFLKQFDAQYDIDIMSSEEIKETIETIKLLLPADDQSRFNINDNNEGEASTKAEKVTIDTLWDRYDAMQEAKLDDRSEEGQDFRASLREFIENNDLDIRVSHRMSNLDILNQIEEAVNTPATDKEADEPVEEPAAQPEKEEEHQTSDEEDDAPAATPRQSRNDDTNEPAARPDRRSARPARRR